MPRTPIQSLNIFETIGSVLAGHSAPKHIVSSRRKQFGLNRIAGGIEQKKAEFLVRLGGRLGLRKIWDRDTPKVPRAFLLLKYFLGSCCPLHHPGKLGATVTKYSKRHTDIVHLRTSSALLPSYMFNHYPSLRTSPILFIIHPLVLPSKLATLTGTLHLSPTFDSAASNDSTRFTSHTHHDFASLCTRKT